MKKRIVVGVMGPGSTANPEEIQNAYEIGSLIAKQGWITLTGGSNTGVMNTALKGAKETDPDCFTVGILSNNGEEDKTSKYLDIKIPTGMGEGRNYLNIKTCDVIVICCDDLFTSLGTMSEFIFALKHKKPIIIISSYDSNMDLLNSFSKEFIYEKRTIFTNPVDAIEQIKLWF